MLSKKDNLELRKIIKTLNGSKLDIKFYSNVCLLFKVYNDLELYFEVPNINELDSGKLINNIAYSLKTTLSLEDLVNIYPMYIESHLHFMIITNSITDNLDLINHAINHPIIKRNEWMQTDINYLKALYSFTCEECDYPLNLSINNGVYINDRASAVNTVKSYNEYIDLLKIKMSQDTSNNTVYFQLLPILIKELINIEIK